MTTSGTASFSMNFTECAEEAYERAGKEMRGGYELRTARRSFNLLMIDWNNRGLDPPLTRASGTISGLEQHRVQLHGGGFLPSVCFQSWYGAFMFCSQ